MSPSRVVQSETESLFAACRAFVGRFYPGLAVEEVALILNTKSKVRLPVPPCLCGPNDAQLTDLQTAILEALAGKAMRTDELAAEVGGDRSRIFKKGGIKELVGQGLVKHGRTGYYRPDDPPDDLEDAQR